MYGGLDYLLAPVDAGYCKYESLLDGTIGLHDIAIMNDMLACKRENESRAHQAAMNGNS